MVFFDEMRLIPPEDAPISEAETVPLTLMWSPGGHTDEYILRLPLVTDFGEPETMLPDRYAEYLSEDLASNGILKWQVTNKKEGHLTISTLPKGAYDHGHVMNAAKRLLQFAQQAEPKVTVPEE